MQLIKDLINLPEIKTVIQLSDLQDERLKRFLTQSFVLTQEVTFGFTHLLESLSKGEGRGCFIQGNFGSGKSHFLTVLSLLLNYSESWEPLIKQNLSFESFRKELDQRRFLTLTISLVEHGGREYLEEIVLKELSHCLNQHSLTPLVRKDSRKETFETLKKELKGTGSDGVVILIDELSEFLRSKPDSRQFNEDIRFLQFLGEIASHFPLWVVATLQERIEETGEITQEVFNKIKDRYPLRFSLGSSHIEELVSARLVEKKPEAKDLLINLFNQIKDAFPTFPFSQDIFLNLYPVHPSTIRLLDNLKTLFSQQRGVVDFIHYQIRGDASRRIEGMLHLPFNCFLTPDAIFDHFRYRIKEMMETNPFHDIVFKFYEDEMERLFPQEAERQLAYKLVKILLLLAITPIKKRYNIRQIAEMMVHKVTELESGINYRYIRGMIDHLYKEGSYLALEKGKDELDDSFFIDLKADINILVKKKTEYIKGSLFEEERRLFDRLIPLLEDPFLPLNTFYQEEKSKRALKWQHTMREGYIMLTQIDELPLDTIETLRWELLKTEYDFCMIVGTTYQLKKQEAHLREILLPHIRQLIPNAFLFWLPLKIQDDSPLRLLLAHVLLMDKYREDETEMGKRIRKHLQDVLEAEKKAVKEIFVRAYFEGTIYTERGEEEIALQQMRHLPFEQLLGEIVPEVLNRRYPKHMEIYPSAEVLTKSNMQDVIDLFLRTGEVGVDKRSQYGLVNTIEGFMEPMGLIKKTPSGYLLVIDPRKSKIVHHLLSLIPEDKILLDELYWHLRKGEYGLSRTQFDLLILSSLFSGQLTPFSKGRKKGLEQVNAYNFTAIDQVGKGEVLPSSLQESLLTLPFFPPRIKKGEFSYALQEEAWNYLKAQREVWREEIEDLRCHLEKFSDYRALSHLDQKGILKDLEKVSHLLEEIKVSFPSKEGLKRFLEAYSQDVAWEENLERIKKVREFFEHNLERYLFIHEYLHDPGLNIPEGKPFQTLRGRREEIEHLLRDGEGIYQEGYMERVKEKFERFHQDYILLYQKEHQKLFQSDRIGSLRQVRDSKRYRLLKQLSSLSFISVKNDRIKIDRLVSSILVKSCSDFYVSALHQRPTCKCGFKLGDILEVPSKEQIESLINQGIIEYIEVLNSPQIHEKVLPFVTGLEDVGRKKDAERVRSLINFTLADGGLERAVDALFNLLNSSLIDTMNEAMSGKAVVVERNLDELYENLIERNFIRKRLEEIFIEWLEGKERIDQETYIKVTAGKRGYGAFGEEGGKLKGVIEQRFPELSILTQNMDEKDFNSLIWITRWLNQHAIAFERIDTLFTFSTTSLKDEWERVVQSLVEMGEYLVGNEEDLAAGLIQQVESEIGSSEKKDIFLNLLVETYKEKDYLLIFKNEKTLSFPLKWVLEKLWRMIATKPKIAKLKDVTLLIEEEKRMASFPSFLKKRDMLLCLKDYLELSNSLEYLKKFDDERLKAYHEWEKLYLKHLAKLPYLYAASYERMKYFQCLDEILMREKKKVLSEVTTRLEKKFTTFYQTSHPVWLGGEVKRPFFMRDVIRVLSEKYMKTFKDHPLSFILLDGMRWDLWCYLKEHFIPSLKGNYRLLEEIPLWAHLPSITAIQMEDLLKGIYSPGGEELSPKVAEEKASYEEKEGECFALENGSKMGINRFIDGKIHTSKDTLFTIFQEINQYLKSSLEPTMEALPKRSLIFLFSDHGFKENPKFTLSDKYKESRYTHGGSSFWEIIVPLAVLLKL